MSAEIEIAAVADRVIDVLLDFNSYATWSGLSDVQVLEEDDSIGKFLVGCTLSTNGISDNLKILVRRQDATTIEWALVESGLLSDLTGKFQVAQVDLTDCRVTYELDIRFKNPIMNMMKKSIEGQMITKVLDRLAKRATQI